MASLRVKIGSRLEPVPHLRWILNEVLKTVTSNITNSTRIMDQYNLHFEVKNLNSYQIQPFSRKKIFCEYTEWKREKNPIKLWLIEEKCPPRLSFICLNNDVGCLTNISTSWGRGVIVQFLQTPMHQLFWNPKRVFFKGWLGD